MANVRNLPKSSAPFLSPEDPDRGDVPGDTDPHYFPATKNFFCPALLGLGAKTKYKGSPYKLLQNDYEIQKASPSSRTFWDDEKQNANKYNKPFSAPSLFSQSPSPPALGVFPGVLHCPAESYYLFCIFIQNIIYFI